MTSEHENSKFHCPVNGCIFANGSERFFKKKMLLDQHLANVHEEKKFNCDNCSRAYAFDWQLKYHLKSCGQQWTCLSCDKIYDQRLSLVKHCQRHQHLLPQNAKIRSAKCDQMTPVPASSTSIIFVPIIITSPAYSPLQQSAIKLISGSGSSATQSSSASTTGSTQSNPSPTSTNIQQRPILPKSSPGVDGCDGTLPNINEVSTQTDLPSSASCVCRSTSVKANSHSSYSLVTRKSSAQSSTQTERIPHKFVKQRESRSAQCPPLTKRKKKSSDCVCIQTQTLESALHKELKATNSSHGRKETNSASTSTSPSKRSRKRSITVDTLSKGRAATRSSTFTQTAKRLRDVETFTEPSNSAISSNPMLSQVRHSVGLSSTPDQSVQTQTTSTEMQYAGALASTDSYNNIHTQTTNIGIGAEHLLNCYTDDDLLFNGLEFTDIETQTIWNMDGTTQTDEHLNDLDDVLKQFFGSDDDSVTGFADTETQTQRDLSSFICSYAQTMSD